MNKRETTLVRLGFAFILGMLIGRTRKRVAWRISDSQPTPIAALSKNAALVSSDEGPSRLGTKAFVLVFITVIGALLTWQLFTYSAMSISSSDIAKFGYEPGGNVAVLTDRSFASVKVEVHEGNTPDGSDPEAIDPTDVREEIDIYLVPPPNARYPKAVPVRVILQGKASLRSLDPVQNVTGSDLANVPSSVIDAQRSDASAKIACGSAVNTTKPQVTADNNDQIIETSANLGSNGFFVQLTGARYFVASVERGAQSYISLPSVDGWVMGGEINCSDPYIAEGGVVKQWKIQSSSTTELDAGVPSPFQLVDYMLPDAQSTTNLKWTGTPDSNIASYGPQLVLTDRNKLETQSRFLFFAGVAAAAVAAVAVEAVRAVARWVSGAGPSQRQRGDHSPV